MASVSMKANLNELDAMLHDLSRGQYKGQYNPEAKAASEIPPERPPPPKGYNNENNATNNTNFLQVGFTFGG